ncbi:MAG: response regulator transcription factor [Dehalococcoidales bacterium]|nr:MAG: response regulator transcription factor [Dehalococcoidales bacterium]
MIFDYLKTIKVLYPEVSIIILFEDIDDELVYTALGTGISAFLTTGVHSDELVTCIRKVSNGEHPIIDTLAKPEIARLIIKDMESDLNGNTFDGATTNKSLSYEEREILHQVANGYTVDQLISGGVNSENDIMQHLTDVYGKLVFNSFCEFSTQSSEISITHDQSYDAKSVEIDTDTQTTDLRTPEENTVNVNDLSNENTSSIWDGFEVLKKELQDTLNKLTAANGHPVNLPEIEHEKHPGDVKQDSTTNEDNDELLSGTVTERSNELDEEMDIAYDSGMSIPYTEELFEKPPSSNKKDTNTVGNNDESPPVVMMEAGDQIADDFKMIDHDYGLNSVHISEDMHLEKVDKIQNPDIETNEYVVPRAEEHRNLPQDVFDTARDLPVIVNDEPMKQKSKWFSFSIKKDNKAGTKNNQSLQNDHRKENPVLEKDRKKTANSVNGKGKGVTQAGHQLSQGEIASSVKDLGVPVFIQAPVDGRQLENLESIITKIDGLNIILRKGTAHEHVLVISGQDPANLLQIFNDIPILENTSEGNGIINLKLSPITDQVK